VSDTWESLSATLFGIPDLLNAACRGRWDLFDPEADREHGQPVEDPHDRHQLAISICLTECGCLDQCRKWAATQKRLSGVVAGVVRHHHKLNKEAA
jgi:Transcription factor WhiB